LAEDKPYEHTDYLDFEISDEIDAIFELYKVVYKFENDEPLNIPNKEQLIEYNRWVILIDDDKIVGFMAMKITSSGLKLCLFATDGSEIARSAIRAFIINALNIDGIYAEVSGAPEKIVVGHVPEVSVSKVDQVLGKPIKQDADGRHYRRLISRVGMRKKLLVGRPFLSERDA